MHYCAMSDGFVPWQGKSEGRRPRKHPFPQTNETVRINLTRKPFVIKFSEEHPEFDGNITTMFFFLLNHYQKTQTGEALEPAKKAAEPPQLQADERQTLLDEIAVLKSNLRKAQQTFAPETMERFIKFKSATNRAIGIMTGDTRFADLEASELLAPGFIFTFANHKVINFDQMLQLLLDYAEADPASNLPTGQPLSDEQKQPLCFPLESSVKRLYTEMLGDEKKEQTETGGGAGTTAGTDGAAEAFGEERN